MTSWLQDLLRAHPEIAFFLVLGLGYLIGRITIGGFKIGAVTGTLLAGVIVGQLGVTMSDQVKQCFFLLFLFAIGFRTGPQFFRGLRSDGLAHAALAAIVAIAGLFVAYGVSLLFGYDVGTAAGLVAGGLTESAAIGTAMDAISKLPVTEAERTALANNIPVAFSVTYMLGNRGRRVGPLAAGAEADARRPRRRVPQARARDEGRRIRLAAGTARVRGACICCRPRVVMGWAPH